MPVRAPQLGHELGGPTAGLDAFPDAARNSRRAIAQAERIFKDVHMGFLIRTRYRFIAL
jgi:hypothetical protein